MYKEKEQAFYFQGVTMPDNIEVKKRKPRGEPPIGFDNPAVNKWLVGVNNKHPEVMAPLFLYAYWLLQNTTKEIPVGNLIITENYLFEHVKIKPGLPKTKAEKNLKKDEWDAWYAWYFLMLNAGLYTTPREAAKLTGRSVNTVKKAFTRAQQDIMNINP